MTIRMVQDILRTLKTSSYLQLVSCSEKMSITENSRDKIMNYQHIPVYTKDKCA